MEKQVINSFDFSNNNKIKELIFEGLGFKEYINKISNHKVVNGLTEKYKF